MLPDNNDRQLTARWIAIRDEMDRRSLKRFEILSQDEIAAFETRANVRLPEAYRQYLLIVGDGGDGPPFAEGVVMLVHTVTRESLPRCSLPFPLTAYWTWEDDLELQPEKSAEIKNGHLVLGHDGCGRHWILIVAGPERGRIWQKGGEGITPCYPKLDFLEWFEYWLSGGNDWWRDIDKLG
jgi:hypothetical protein